MGINFNDLPKHVQAKIEPYMIVAGSVENAIDAAVASGKMDKNEADALKNGLSGNKNWGATDGFDPSKAKEYKAVAQSKQQKQGKGKREQQFLQFTDENGDFSVKETLLTAAKIVLSPLAIFSSCSEKDEISVPVNVSQNVNIPINIPMKDYTGELLALKAQLQGLRGDMDKYNKEAVDKFNAIIDKLNQITTNQEVSEAQFNQLLDDINKWMKLVTENQINIQTDINTNFQELFARLERIVNDTSMSVQQKYEKLMELLAQIKTVGETISAKIDVIIEQLAKALGNDEIIIAKLNKLDKNDEAIYSVLVGITNAINNLGQDFAPYFRQIISGIADGNIKADQANNILQAIKANTDNIKALLTKYGDAGINLGNAILNALKAIEAKPNVDLSAIEALLGNISSNQSLTNDKITNLTDLFNKYGEGVNNKLNTIIALLKGMPNYDAKLNAILNAIGSIQGGSEKDYEAQLNKIIDLLGKLDKNNDARNQKVLDAIAKLGVNVSSSLTAILNKIGQGGQDGKDYSSVLNAILAKLGTIDANNTKNFNRVIEALGKISVGQTTDVDLQPILDKLDEILKAIKDHKVTVDVTGKVTCECNCGNGTVHEGILGDLNDLLG